jgi:hypothetical protein
MKGRSPTGDRFKTLLFSCHIYFLKPLPGFGGVSPFSLNFGQSKRRFQAQPEEIFGGYGEHASGGPLGGGGVIGGCQGLGLSQS